MLDITVDLQSVKLMSTDTKAMRNILKSQNELYGLGFRDEPLPFFVLLKDLYVEE